MTFWVYLPLALSLLLPLAAHALAERAQPAPAAVGLSAAAGVAGGAYACCLLLLTLTLLDDLPPFEAHQFRAGSALPEPVPDQVALAAVAVLAWGVYRLVVDVHRRRETHRRLRAAGTPQDRREGGLVVAEWTAPYAVAVPGRPGHVLLTTGMLKALEPAERRVVFAHERSHLRHRHHRLVGVAACAAAVNPLLVPVRGHVGYLVERWADEDAAAAVGDRGLVARSVAKAALATVDDPIRSTATPATPAPPGTLGAHGADAVRRVRAMTRPAVTGQRRRLALVAALAACFAVAAFSALTEFAMLADAWVD
jgi:Zn-dependent protease with chaperone function